MGKVVKVVKGMSGAKKTKTKKKKANPIASGKVVAGRPQTSGQSGAAAGKGAIGNTGEVSRENL